MPNLCNFENLPKWHGASRDLKISQDTLVKKKGGGCFAQNGDGQHPHTHPCCTQIQVWLLAFWCSCQICVNKLFRVHCKCTTRYHQKRTCWRHVHYWEGGVGLAGVHALLKFPNLQKKVPQIAVCETSESEKLEILYIFGQKNRSNFRKGSSFSDLHPLRPKKSRLFEEMPTFINSGRDPLLKNLHPPQKKKSLVWAWLKPVKCIGLGSRVGA